MTDINAIATLLQTLFGPKAHEIAFSCGFPKRPSKLGAAELAYALVGGWLVNPHASRSQLAQLTQVSKQALDQSLTQNCATFLNHVGILRQVNRSGGATLVSGRKCVTRGRTQLDKSYPTYARPSVELGKKLQTVAGSRGEGTSDGGARVFKG